MSSILKVDQIQLSNGNTPTAGDLGLNITGNILQVKSVHKSDTFSTGSTTFVDVTGLSVSITPVSTSSKILVISDVAMGNNASVFTYYRVTRDNTAINIGDAASNRVPITGMVYDGGNEGILERQSSQFIDSPSTTNSVTYKIQLRSATGGTVYINRSKRDDSVNTGYDTRQASSLILMEIAG